ncbi:MAG: hypothetical protein LUC24_03905 [Bacteroidales bacterium]|nr:hypothetical protein [Bacteroidales bacterium]
MERIEKFFGRFADFLEAEAEAERDIPDFGDLCRVIGAPEKELDDYLQVHFGMGGAEIVRSYRTATPVQFL